MAGRSRVTLLFTAAGAVVLAACAEQSPVAPGAGPDQVRLAATAAAGTYELTFHLSGAALVPVTSGPVGTEMGVRATVRNASGALATTGSVTFERCMAGGAQAPSAVCNGGAGRWTRVMSVRIDASGFPPTISGGTCHSPTTVGYRFRYTGQKGGIASGVSESRDFSWVEAPAA